MVIEGMTQLFNGDLGFTCIALLTSFWLFGERTFFALAYAIIPVNLFTHDLFYWDFY
jgi:hypothetical protein